MSSTCGYLVPDKEFTVGEFKKAIQTILEKDQIIYKESADSLTAGDRSLSFFTRDSNSSAFAFDSADIHDTVNRRLIPEEWGIGNGAKCQKCQSFLDEQLSDILSDLYEREYDNNQETDMAILPVICDNCQHTNQLIDMYFESDVEIRSQYIQFINIENEFHPDKVKELGDFLNCNLKIFYSLI